MTRTKKVKKEIFKNYLEILKKAKLIVFLNILKTKTQELNELRGQMPETAKISVILKRIFAKALQKNQIKTDELAQRLEGSVAVLIDETEDLESLKKLYQFVKEFEKPQILAGILNKEILDIKKIEALAKLPSKEVLTAQVVGAVASPLSGLVYSLKYNLIQLLLVLKAIEQSKK